MGMLMDLVTSLLRTLAGLGARLWKRSHPDLVEGLSIKGGDDLPPSYIFRYQPGPAPSDPILDPIRYAAWGEQHGASYAGKTFMSFALSSEETTRVGDLRVVVAAHHPPLQGWLYHPPPVGGPSTVHTIRASLDSASRPGSVPTEKTRDSGEPGGEEVWSWPWSVSQDDPLVLDLVVSVERGCYEWYIEVEYSTRGAERRTTRMPRGKPWISSSSDDCQKLDGSW